jgi:dihydroxy-acid dehydratase
MGTASTMALCAEAMGMMLPGGAAIPAVLAERVRNAEATGKRAVELAKEGLKPRDIMTPEAIENALRVLLAVGGSTNAIVHLAAVAGRLGFELDLDAFDRMGQETPVLVDLKPTGQHYMEHLYEAGGLATILRELKPLMNLKARTVTGRTLDEDLAAARVPEEQDVVRTRENPVFGNGGIAVLRGNLAPDGAIIKQAAATARLMTHTGRAVVFESLEDLANRIDDPKLDVTADDVLVLKNAGPKGAPGMPEAGYIPIPRKLAEQGVKDMVRISDARMSGTAFGSIVLHVTPESAVGGPLALVKNGDRIRLDVPQRRLELLVDEAELAARRKQWQPPEHDTEHRGYRKLFLDTVQQADRGCDFDFLAAKVTMRVPRTP